MPATQVLPLAPPLLLVLPPELEPPELDPPELEPPELEPPELEEDSPQKNDLFAFPQAVSPFEQTPSTHAAARYESPLSQSQHVGLQSANVEHEEPLAFVPFSFCGFDGQPPFTCSACEDTFVEDDPDEEVEEEVPDGLVGSELPVTSVPLAPEQATRRKSEEKAMRQPSFMRRASAMCGPLTKGRILPGRASCVASRWRKPIAPRVARKVRKRALRVEPATDRRIVARDPGRGRVEFLRCRSTVAEASTRGNAARWSGPSGNSGAADGDHGSCIASVSGRRCESCAKTLPSIELDGERAFHRCASRSSPIYTPDRRRTRI